MSRDIYAALSGASATMRELDVLANDVANASTTGFKGGRAVFSLSGPTSGPMGQAYATMSEVSLDLTQGAIRQDGDPLHVALDGRGYLAVATDRGERLTRDGRLAIRDGRLCAADGSPLIGADGKPIAVPDGATLRIDAAGEVKADGALLGKLRLVDGPASAEGADRFVADGPMGAFSGSVVQGGLEASNVNPMVAMVELVTASRHFEAYQKAMQASDELDERLNRMGGAS